MVLNTPEKGLKHETDGWTPNDGLRAKTGAIPKKGAKGRQNEGNGRERRLLEFRQKIDIVRKIAKIMKTRGRLFRSLRQRRLLTLTRLRFKNTRKKSESRTDLCFALFSDAFTLFIFEIFKCQGPIELALDIFFAKLVRKMIEEVFYRHDGMRRTFSIIFHAEFSTFLIST